MNKKRLSMNKTATQSLEKETLKDIKDTIIGMKVEFESKLRDLDLSNKAAQLEGNLKRIGHDPEAMPY